jgi:hypothetical protein
MNELALLLDDVEGFVRRYVNLTDEQAWAVALWTIHTHCIDALEISPYLSITSATKQSGKTQLLEVLELMVARPWMTGSVSAATLARKIHAQQPTLLLDESDTAFRGDKDYAETLRGVLNSGFKRSGTYSRCVGTNGTNLNVEDFRTFSAKAIAGIGKLPDTVADRSIPIRMKPLAPGERIERKYERRVRAEAAPLRERIEAWSAEHADRVGELEHAPLQELSPRAADIWEPLLALAYLSSNGKTWERWLHRARRAALALSARNPDDDETSVRLLSDVRAIFEDSAQLFSETIIDGLHSIEDAPWNEWHGKPLSKNALARIFARFDIRPRKIRIGDSTANGYRREDFADAWSRHLPPFATRITGTSAWLSEESAEDNRNILEPVPIAESAANPHEHRDVPVVPVAGGGSANRRPLPGDDGYLERAFAAFENGYLTESEWRRAEIAHRSVVRAVVR